MGKRRRGELNESEGEDSAAPPTTQPAKRARAESWSFPDELQSATHICQKLYDFLRKVKDSDNRLLCECLIRVPSRRSHPDYYDIVKTPIDLMRMQQKLKTEEYRCVRDFLCDVRLLLDNARLFYEADSEELGCVDELEQLFSQRLHEYTGHFSSPATPTATPTEVSPQSLTLRIPKDHLRGALSSGKPGQSSSKTSYKTGQAAVKPAPGDPSSSSSTSRLQLRIKVTRSKAWLEDYLASGDPLKMYMAAVYDHRDAAGVCLAEVFHELPSAKDYPEYYQVITEPIDLNIMRRNLEEGHYTNLRQIQEDMILMIKNAHHFNEPGSEIYKMASTLRKFIISHCAELERRYHTVPKPLKGSLKRGSEGGDEVEGGEEGEAGGGTEERRVPKLKVKLSDSGVGVKVRSGSVSDAGSGGGVKGGRRLSRSSKTPEVEDSNVSDSSGEETSLSEGEGEGEGEWEGSELVLKKPKISLKGRDDPMAKLLKSRRPPPLKKQQLALYCHLVGHTDSYGRQTAELFMRKPSAKAYPEYYVVIQKPTDFREIAQKIKQEQYPGLEDMMADVELLVNNAMTFNEEDSTVYQDAQTLQRLAGEAVQKLCAAWTQPKQLAATTSSSPVTVSAAVPAPRGRGRPKKIVGGAEMGGVSVGTPLLPIQSPISSLFMAIKMFTVQGRAPWRALLSQPATGAVDAKKDLSVISTKYANNKFSSVHQLYRDLHQAFDHLCQTQPRESLQYKDSLNLCQVAAKKYLDLTAEERKTSRYPDVQAAVQAMLRSILTKTLLFQDSLTGALPAESLRDVTLTREIPADGDEPPMTHKLTLSLLEKWVGLGCYQRLDSFQNDLLALLKFAREKVVEGSGLWRDSVALAKAYLQARDRVVNSKEGYLSSPALSYTLADLERETSSLLSPPAGATEKTERSEEAVNLLGLERAVPSSAECLDQLTVSDVTYCVGDVVYLTARNDGQKSHIVLIEKLWRDSSDSAWLHGCWYYRPEETFHLATRKFYEKEVFRSDFRSMAKLSDVVGKCCVLVVKDFVRFLPQGFAKEDVFVCESRYAHKTKSFKKIKNWSYPPGWQPQLIARDVPILLSRVPSMFMTQSTRITGSSSHTLVPESDTTESREPPGDACTVDPSLPYPEEFENVRGTVPSPTPGCVYYEQYCIDEDRFRLGDCVYVRSDQEKPFIARIERMWTDANGDPWFHGPWFVYPEEVNHSPTRLFLERELFMSSIHDTNPMRSIIGRCSVMSHQDYCKRRETEFSECDVFVVESKYQEAEGEILKVFKGLAFKPFQLSKEVQLNEIFCFQKEIQPRKVPSPKLLAHVVSPASTAPSLALPANSLLSSSSQPSSGHTTPVPPNPTRLVTPSGHVLSISGSQPTPPGVPQPPTTVANVVSINPQLLQALLASASQASTSKPVVIPFHQSPVYTTHSGTGTPTARPVVSSAAPAAPAQPKPSPISASSVSATMKVESNKSTPLGVGYVCMWDECGERFDGLTTLTTHLMLNAVTSHLIRDADGNFYCRWANCPRNPRHGGRAFDAMPKITRHVKEVHLLKLSQTALGLNPRSHVIQGQSVRPPAPSPSSMTPPPAPSPAFQIPSSILSSPLPIAHIPIVTPPAILAANTVSLPAISHPTVTAAVQAQTVSSSPTPSSASSAAAASAGTAQPSQSQGTGTASLTSKPIEVSSLFLPPPANKKPLLHSAIYTKYIQNLQRGARHTSSLQTSDQLPPEHRATLPQQQIQISDWLSPDAIPQDMTVSEALLTLRDHLLQDSLKLGQHLKPFQ